MADIKNITIDGVNYDLKDAKAREDVTDLKEDLKIDIDDIYAPDWVTLPLSGEWLTGYIDYNGILQSSAVYSHTDPIKLLKGQTVCVNTAYYGFSAISLTDASATFYTPVVKVESNPTTTVYPYYYEATEDCYIAASAYSAQNSQSVQTKHDAFVTNNGLKDAFNKFAEKERSGELDVQDVNWLNQYIDFNGNLATATNYAHTDPIALKKGQIVVVKSAYYLFSAISLTDAVGSYYLPLVKVESGSNVIKSYSYYAEEDCYVALSAYNNIPSLPAEVEMGYAALVTNNDLIKAVKDYCGINIFPFRTITNRETYLYKEALVAGMKPPYNFDILPDIRSTNIDNYSEKTFRLYKETANTYPITVTATDAKNNTTSKTVNVTCASAPSKKLVNKSELNVCFIGDSLIFANDNLIGAEWLRMLNTDDSETHINGDAIQLPTLNATDGKIILCGEQTGSHDAKYTIAASSYLMCTGKRESAEGAAVPYGENPFYNPESSEADELGADGINKRVDFGWWFDKEIGVGKNPDIIYLATSPNDYANTFGWVESAVPTVVSQMINLCKKIKSVCDSRSGGSSGLVIKVLQHQPYAYACPELNFPSFMQRVLWHMTAEQFYNEIANNNMGSYVEIIPLASMFDIDVGYNRTAISSNARFNGNSDYYVSGNGIHMNTVGAYNYADGLVYDFMADGRFD